MFVGPRSATGARGRGCSPAREPSPSWVSPWPLWRAFRLGASRGVFRRTPPPRPRRGSNPALTAAPAPSSQVPRMQPLPAVVREAVPDGRPDGLDERLVLRAPPLHPPPRLRLRRVRLPPHRPAQRPHPPRRCPRRGGPQDPRRARPHRRRRAAFGGAWGVYGVYASSMPMAQLDVHARITLRTQHVGWYRASRGRVRVPRRRRRRPLWSRRHPRPVASAATRARGGRASPPCHHPQTRAVPGGTHPERRTRDANAETRRRRGDESRALGRLHATG